MIVCARPASQPQEPPQQLAPLSIGAISPSAVRVKVANIEITRLFVTCPSGQVAGSSLLLIGRSTSKRVPHGGQKYSYSGIGCSFARAKRRVAQPPRGCPCGSSDL